MAHPFQDKLFVFIGNLVRCSRQKARDMLTEVGGVTDDRIGVFTHYAVAFNGAETTKVFQRAKERDSHGHMVLLNEGQFFNVLEGNAKPPEKKVLQPRKGTVIFPATNPEAAEREHDRWTQYVVNKKRAKNMARYGVPTPEVGRIRADFRNPESIRQIVELMKSNATGTVMSTAGNFDWCDNCGKSSKVIIDDIDGNIISNVCLDCYNLLMAEMTGTEVPPYIPKKLSFESNGGETRDFEIEFIIYANGKSLTAIEIGETKRKADVFGALDDDFEKMLEALSERIKKTLSVTYMKPDGYFTENKAVGYIEYNSDREACKIIIDGKPYTLEDLTRNIFAHNGWKIKIEFGDIGDELD
jgi:hypothetical protein